MPASSIKRAASLIYHFGQKEKKKKKKKVASLIYHFGQKEKKKKKSSQQTKSRTGKSMQVVESSWGMGLIILPDI